MLIEEFPGGLVVKDLKLALLWLWSDLWPRKFCMLQVWPKKKKSTVELILYIHFENVSSSLYCLFLGNIYLFYIHTYFHLPH